VKGSLAIAQLLKEYEVKHLFCFPANPLIDAAASVGIKPIIARTERGAVNMADGYSRLSPRGTFGVVTMQDGPGIENAFGGIAHAFADSIPILVLPRGTTRARQSYGPYFSAITNYAHVTKWTAQINMPERIPELMRHAFTKLRTATGAPVLLEVPYDILTDEVGDLNLSSRYGTGYQSSGDPVDIKNAISALLSAAHPVIHAGQGILDSEASSELLEFAELVQAPVMTITPGKSGFPEHHPLSIGNGATTATGMVDYFLGKADLVFGIGSNFYRSLMSVEIPPGKTMIQCTANEQDLNNEYALEYGVLGDPKLVLQQLIAEVRFQTKNKPIETKEALLIEIQKQRNLWLTAWMPKLISTETPINPYRVIFELNNAVDHSKTVVTHDSGNPRDQMTPFFESTTPKGYIGWGNSTQLGYSLGISIGGKLATPDKTFIHVLGDAAMGMIGLDLESSVRAAAPIVTIVLNNGRMGGYGNSMPNATETYDSNLLGGNYSEFGKSMGLKSERVSNPNDIHNSIKRAIQSTQEGHSALVEFMTGEESHFSRVSWM
jgi:acetolactate synthase-1/2/3 large subunit